MRVIPLILLTFLNVLSYGQHTLSSYEPIVVPKKLKYYYQNIDFSKRGEALKEELAVLTIVKHTRILPYSKRHPLQERVAQRNLFRKEEIQKALSIPNTSTHRATSRDLVIVQKNPWETYTTYNMPIGVKIPHVGTYLLVREKDKQVGFFKEKHGIRPMTIVVMWHVWCCT